MADITTKDLVDMFVGIAAAIEAEKGRLSELDGVIGDADHGVTMSIGFSAVNEALSRLDQDSADPATVLTTSAKAFLNAEALRPVLSTRLPSFERPPPSRDGRFSIAMPSSTWSPRWSKEFGIAARRTAAIRP